MFRIDCDSLQDSKICYHGSYRAIKDQSAGSSHVSLNTDENFIRTNTNIARQERKVIKAENESNSIGEIAEMGTISKDTEIPNIEVSSPNYVPSSLEVCSRSQYSNYNPMEQSNNQSKEEQIYSKDDKSCQYDPYRYSKQYVNSNIYDISTPLTRRQRSYFLKYSSNERISSPQSANDPCGSSPIPINTSISQNQIVTSTAYLAPHYDEMQDYRVAPTSGSGANQYVENAGLVYGYLSATNYAVPTNRVSTNPNTFTMRTLLDDNLNRPISHLQDISHSAIYEDEQLQNRTSHLSLEPHNISTFHRVASEECVDSNGESCQTLRWRDPNLSEVISFLNSSNNEIVANAAAYLQHLCYMDDPNKQRTRTLGGIPPLIRLLSHEIPEIHKTACGALRNLSYGRQNDENKRAIKNAGGIAGLIKLLCRSHESDVKELVTGVIWNMSSCEDLKRAIIDESLDAMLTNVIKPHSGYDTVCPGEMCASTVFRNASGVLRNASSAGEYARTKLRDCKNLVECLLYVLRTAITTTNMDSKIVENCVCILRNLSYRCQEVEDPNYDKYPIPNTLETFSSSKDNLGCFGISKKRKECLQDEFNDSIQSSKRTQTAVLSSPSPKGFEQLWQPEVVQYYLFLLQSCSNPETLEAAAGAIQNLAACYWQPSVEIRAAVRKEKGLPILVELLRMEVDRVVCAVATALRNLAIDQRNKELIGKYAMRDLVQKLPSGNQQHDLGTSDDTIAAVLATINEVIKKNAEFSRSLLDAGGIERLMNITRQRQKFTSCVLKFASQVLFTMWQHQELRDVYKKHGWKEQDFVTKTVAARNAGPNSPNNANSTLNRPMASQGQTRYEDRTMKKVSSEIEVSANNGQVSSSKKATTKLYQRVESQPASGLTWQQSNEDAAAIIYPPNNKNERNHST